MRCSGCACRLPCASLAAAAALLPSAALLYVGALDELSLLKEYANRQQAFHQAFARHLVIVGTALLPAVLLGWPLGVAAHARPAFARPLFATLGVLQTVPAIALFGLLIAPLAALGTARRGLAAGGDRACCCTACCRSCAAPRPGWRRWARRCWKPPPRWALTPRQRFWQVRVPLALPLLLSGLRVCCVQAIGLGVLAALIGAGGLGAIMFQGLLGTALDLVLLGVLPVVALALAVDAAFRLASAAAAPHAA